ncbi:MAG: glycosyltransferase family 39 protein [Eubacteriales bacterium]|nr:glycosyltransferase family 39 protein [Eubacteriales bacterium]
MWCKRWAALAAAILLLFAVAPASLAQETENLLQNAAFESSDADGLSDWYFDAWETEEGYTDAGVAFDESRASQVAYLTNHETNDSRWCQSVTVEPNTYYRLSGYVMARGADGSWGASLAIDQTYAHTQALTDAGWTYVEIIGCTQEEQTSAVVQLRLGGYGSTTVGSAYFDDVKLEKLDSLPEGAVAQSWATFDTASSSGDDTDAKSGKGTFGFVLIAALYALIFCAVARKRLPGNPWEFGKKAVLPAVLILAAAFLLRCILALAVYGYPNDIGCWLGWAEQAVQSDLFRIYNEASFLDYPPGYLYVLYLLGWVNRLPLPAGWEVLVVKLPSIIADFATAYLIYRIAKKMQRPEQGIVLGVLYLFNPLVILDSSAWGQIDSILTLFLVASLYAAWQKKPVWAAAIYGLGLTVKPQMLLFAPLMLMMLIVEMRSAGSWKKALLTAVKTLGAGAAALVIPSLPFWIASGDPMWLFNLYGGTMGSYDYGSVNACNLAAFFGGNWRAGGEKFLFLSYDQWGLLGILLSCGYVFCRYVIREKAQDKIFLYGAVLLCGIYTLGHQMHERYLFPIVALLFVYYLMSQNKRVLYAACALTAVQFLNVAIVLAEQYILAPLVQSGVFAMAGAGDGGYRLLALSLGMVCCLVYLLLIERNVMIPLKIKPDEKAEVSPKEPRPLVRMPREKVKWCKKDHLLMWGLTLIYAIVAVVYLGDTDVPVKMWKANASNSYAVVDLGQPQELSEFWCYFGLTKGDMTVAVSEDGENWKNVQTMEYVESTVFQIWDKFSVGKQARYVRFTVTTPTVRLLEVAFKDAQGNTLVPVGIADQGGCESDAAALIDEQDRIPEQPSQMNSTYFDEIYHARTAWEHLNGMKPYETTHPPLGKLIISVGIALFDMTPFGWRIMGTLFGVFMIPLVYWFAKELFRETRYAFIASFLIAFDFMHFTQTRIATIDTYGVFFIILMFGFMYQYLTRTNYNVQPLRKTLLPLGLCGLAFGLGAASKWTGLYAGAGLAIIFFYSIFCRAREYAAARSGAVEGELAQTIRRNFWRNTILTLLCCIVFFIVIPAAIYVASYIPYAKGVNSQNLLKTVWDSQLSMFRYHSQLVDDHFFKSPWYQWPLIIKPIWFYKNSCLPEGWMGSIASFGNPAVWLPGTAAMIWLIVRIIKNRRMQMPDVFILAGYLTQYLPWVLVPRSMFIYHYFPAVPFFIMAIVMWIREWETKKERKKQYIWVYLAVVLLLFVLFYPVLSGLPIPSWYGKLLRWLPTWYFTY